MCFYVKFFLTFSKIEVSKYPWTNRTVVWYLATVKCFRWIFNECSVSLSERFSSFLKQNNLSSLQNRSVCLFGEMFAACSD
jgi:hypothetical protein